MNHEIASTFDSIESAHEFVGLLAEAVAVAKQELEGDVQRESTSKFPRRLQALQVALYNVEKLQLHMSKSRRILNDLRTLRRLLFEERTTRAAPAQPKPILAPILVATAETPSPTVLSHPSSVVNPSNGKPQSAVAA